MTIDEAIKHAEEVADEKKKEACNLYDAKNYEESRECIWCAEEHRQLAEWLTDYKRLLEQQPITTTNNDEPITVIYPTIVCDDAINRILARMWNCRGKHTTSIDKVKMEQIIREELPSVTQKYGKWIPVSERLPEAFSFVNCTCHSLIDDREDWVVETCYLPQLPDSPYSDWGNIPMLNMGDCEVVAWMYRDIPKPYKVEPQERSGKE